MVLTNLERLKLDSYMATYGILSVPELHILYKDSLNIYHSLSAFDTAKIKFLTDVRDFSMYGSLLLKASLENEDNLNYQVDTKASTQAWNKRRSQNENSQLVKEIARITGANFYIPTEVVSLFYNSGFIIPNEHTDHDLLKEFLKEYSLSFKRISTEFSFVEFLKG